MKNSTLRIQEFTVNLPSKQGALSLDEACEQADAMVVYGSAVHAAVKDSNKVVYYVHEAFNRLSEDEKRVAHNWFSDGTNQ